MSFITNLFSGGASTLVDSVGKVLDNVVTTKEEKMQLENEIRKSDMHFQVEEQQMVLGDLNSARQREVQVQSSEYATQLAKNVAPYLALGTTLITLALFCFLMFSTQELPAQKKDIILYVLGVLSAILTQIYSYYFGSSAGSAAKSKTLANISEKQ
jgi:hypothetical protein